MPLTDDVAKEVSIFLLHHLHLSPFFSFDSLSSEFWVFFFFLKKLDFAGNKSH